jgi:hypothetical protein
VPDGDADFILDLQYLPFDEFLANFWMTVAQVLPHDDRHYFWGRGRAGIPVP